MTLLEAPASPLGFGGPEKAAAVLLGLDRDVAQLVLRHFSEDELRLVARTAAELSAIPHTTLDDICEDLRKQITAEMSAVVGDVARAENLLTGVVVEPQLSDILSDLRGVSNAMFWPRLANLPEKTLADHLLGEHPQVAAIILMKIDSAYAARVLAELPGETRTMLMRRILVSRPIQEFVMRTIEQVLQQELFAGVGGPGAAEMNTQVAGIINQLERDQVNEILDGLGRYEPVIAAQLKSLIFSFEDIVTLDQRARLVIFDQTPTDRVILALRNSDEAIRQAILPCLSARTRRMVEAELASGMEAPKRDIQAAQRQIADTVLQLAERGLISLSSNGDGAEG